MASLPTSSIFTKTTPFISSLPFLRFNASLDLFAETSSVLSAPKRRHKDKWVRAGAHKFIGTGRVICRSLFTKVSSRTRSNRLSSKKMLVTIPRSSGSSNSENTEDESDQVKAPFGYNRKDVLLIGVGITILGVGLKSGLEFVGVDPLQAGNVVQLIFVLGLTVGWISTYLFRVANKDMTYAQQLRDYETKVMEKRLESLSEGELEALLEEVEEEKRLASGEQIT